MRLKEVTDLIIVLIILGVLQLGATVALGIFELSVATSVGFQFLESCGGTNGS